MWEKTIAVSRYYAKIIEQRLRGKHYDIIFAEKGSFCIAYLDTKIPVIYETDATFKAMEGYYPEFSPVSRDFSEGGNIVEKSALEKAALVIAVSQWAADSMMRDYGISGNKIEVITCPPNFDVIPPVSDVLKKKEHDICGLLFVGVDWERKGGDIAADAVDWLNREGIRAKLFICGCIPPRQYLRNSHIEVMGFLDKNTEEGGHKLQNVFLSSHFLILPTRAECFGQALAEASAFALPIITTNTGGIPSVVFDGQNGFLLDLNAKGSDFGKVIKELWEDTVRYDALRSSARKVFEERLSSKVWVESMRRAIEKALGKSQDLQ